MLIHEKRVLISNLCKNSFSHWIKIPLAPPDKILGLNDLFNKDKNELKVNLGVGAYRDSNGNPLVLSSVKKAKDLLAKLSNNHEYASIAGGN